MSWKKYFPIFLVIAKETSHAKADLFADLTAKIDQTPLLEKSQPLLSSVILPCTCDARLGDAFRGEQPIATATHGPKWPALENTEPIRRCDYFKQLFVLENKYLY